MKRALLILGLFVAACMDGCATQPISQPINAAGDALSQTTAFVTAAKTAVTSASVNATPTQSGYLASASSDLTQALASNTTATTQFQTVEADLQTLTATVAKVTGSIGYRIQVWVTRFFWVFVALLAVHVVAGGLAIFYAPAAPIASLVSYFVNPLGWLTAAVAMFSPKPATTALLKKASAK